MGKGREATRACEVPGLVTTGTVILPWTEGKRGGHRYKKKPKPEDIYREIKPACSNPVGEGAEGINPSPAFNPLLVFPIVKSNQK